jgi:hypothetical protein
VHHGDRGKGHRRERSSSVSSSGRCYAQVSMRRAIGRTSLKCACGLVCLSMGLGVHSADAERFGTGSNLSPAQVFDRSHRWHLFYSGRHVFRQGLTDVYDYGERGHRVWSFFYGAEALEVQNWSACARFWGQYHGRPRIVSYHGAKAAWIHNVAGSWLEVYSGRTTIVAFGSRALAWRAAWRLRRVNAGRRSRRLAPPVEGALSGRLRCQRSHQ